jgi:Kef-type K+ transport system membrane component KefB
MVELPKEFQYILLLFGLLVLPKALQRFRVPSAITTLALGLAFGAGLGYFLHDETVHLLSTFGIAALFLFAGLDVDASSLRREARILSEHLLIVALTVAIAAIVVQAVFPLGTREAVLVGLALVTPSCGFILDSLASLGVTSEEGYWIRTKAIASEILALGVLFVTLQSTSAARLGFSAVALLGMAALLPVLLRFLVSRVSPFAPNSEFAFLLMVAVVFAYATRQLGVYYLVGAFLVGVTARRLREQLPRLASDQNLHAVEVFASFFVPFYFFNAGLSISREALTWEALAIGLAFGIVSVPVRVGLVLLQRRVRLSEAWSQAMRVAVPMIPTLVFTLVLAEILRTGFLIDPALFGGLVVYAAFTTILPAMVFRAPRAVFEVDQDMLLVGSGGARRTPVEADGAVPDLTAADGGEPIPAGDEGEPTDANGARAQGAAGQPVRSTPPSR